MPANLFTIIPVLQLPLGPDNELVHGNAEYVDLFRRFENILRVILPKEIGFNSLAVDPPEVLLVTDSGDFPLDAMSGGINSIVGIAWQILMKSSSSPVSTIVIDEPENHLHPSMQRTLLGSLANAFPECRFIVATHSPFIVTSMDTARVYGFSTGHEDGVRSQLIEVTDLAGTPNKTLREVLKMETLTPVWAEKKLRDVLERMQGRDPKEVAREVFLEMRDLGMADDLSDFSEEPKEAE